jgi:hypothetical protein
MEKISLSEIPATLDVLSPRFIARRVHVKEILRMVG